MKVIISISDPITSFRNVKKFQLTHVTQFIKSCVEFLNKYNFDGISNNFIYTTLNTQSELFMNVSLG
jgi:GH18 family chitinase